MSNDSQEQYTDEERATIERKLRDAERAVCDALHNIVPELTAGLLKALAIKAKNFVIEHCIDDDDVKLVAYETYLTSLTTGLYNATMDYLGQTTEARTNLILNSIKLWSPNLSTNKDTH